MVDEGNDKRPPRPPMLLAKCHGYWGWYAREMHQQILWVAVAYGGGAMSVGDFQDYDPKQSDAEAVEMLLQDVENEKQAADELGGEPHLPLWERY